MKNYIMLGLTAIVCGFLGKVAYEVISKPDGELYVDEAGYVYAALSKSPEEYKKGSRLLFVYKG